MYSLPDLDLVKLAALDLFLQQGVPRLDPGHCKKMLVMGSDYPVTTGRILLEKAGAVLADESTYEAKLFNGCCVIGRLQSQYLP
jgi:hypothetical protein